MGSTARPGADHSAAKWGFWAAYGLILSSQVFICFLGLGDYWVRGHNGWNGAAYHLSARNALRWGLLFPLQYYTGRTPPTPDMVYTHHPLAMHLHNTASLWLFGDTEAAIRLVPAIHGVLVVAALVLVVRRFYGPTVGLLAGAIYVILPINAIYANMMNHSSGFIFWSLLSFYCYFRFQQARAAAASGADGEKQPYKRWYAGLFATFFMAANWDWPAYYIALFIAIHWFLSGIARRIRSGRPLWRLGADIWLLLPFCVFVLSVFAGHLALIHFLIGSFHELAGTVNARRGIPWDRFRQNLEVVPELMFTYATLGMCALWLLVTLGRTAIGRFQMRDLMPLAYGLGGVTHYWIFRWSAIVHSYWAWTMLPFVAISAAVTVVWVGGRLRKLTAWSLRRIFQGRWTRPVAAVVGMASLMLLVPLVERSIDLSPKGRSVGGSLWFVTEVRGPVWQEYISGRKELRFADRVREWTNRSTGVMIHDSFNSLAPEGRFDTTLDREILYVPEPRRYGPERIGLDDGWVFIGLVDSVRHNAIVRLAADYPYYQYGDFFMVDLRGIGPDIRIWSLEPRPTTIAYWFWRSPFEGPVEEVRQPEAEVALLGEIRALASTDYSSEPLDSPEPPRHGGARRRHPVNRPPP